MAARRARAAALREELLAREQTGWRWRDAGGQGDGQGADGQGAGARRAGAGVLSLGRGFDEVLPWGGLARGVLHEARAASYLDGPALMGWAAGLAARAQQEQASGGRAVFWVRARGLAGDVMEAGAPYPPGLARAFGLDLSRFVLVEPPDARRLFWAGEEIAREGCAALAILETPEAGASLAMFRRLQLVLEEAGGLMALLRGARSEQPSGARTRWSIAAAPSRARNGPGRAMPGLGPPRWGVRLGLRGRGAVRSFVMEWDHETHRFDMAGPLADRSAEASGAA